MAEAMNGNGLGVYKAVAMAAAVAAVITPLYYQVQSQESQMKELREVFKEALSVQHEDAVAAAYHRGTVDQRIEAIMDRQDKNIDDIAAVDERLQREMRDVNAVTDTKLEGLDQRVQTEITNVTQLQQQDIESTRREVDGSRDRQLTNSIEIGKLIERVKHLEGKDQNSP